MNRLLDAGAADEAHPLADLVATPGELIGDYDALNYPATDVPPRAVLRAMMDQQPHTERAGARTRLSRRRPRNLERQARNESASNARSGSPLFCSCDGVCGWCKCGGGGGAKS